MSCILIAGSIAAGKSTVAAMLAECLDCDVVRVRDALMEVLPASPVDRRRLQELGADLDRRTAGRWLLEYLLARSDVTRNMVVDSLRTERQTTPILVAIPGSRLVYLDAHPSTRRQRFQESRAGDPLKQSLSFDKAMQYPTEIGVVRLRAMADVVVETDDLPPSDVVEEIVNALQLD